MNKNNKGFTLVELIIVVAIIAVLAGVLAPQYLRYVERAKESNDLQIATSLVKAATVAIADPKSNVPPDAIIEVLWATGYDESSTYHNWILVRDASGGARVSALRPTLSDYPTAKMTDLEELQNGIIGIMGYTATKSSNGDWYAVMDKVESAAGSQNNFAFHISPSSGEIVAAYHSIDGEKNIWVDQIGVKITPAP